MITQLRYVSIPVRDLDDSIRFYTEVLGFDYTDGSASDHGAADHGATEGDVADGRTPWIVLRPPQGGSRIVLMPHRQATAGGPVLLFGTDDLHATCAELERNNVNFVRPPQFIRQGAAIIEDPSGNQLVLTSVA